MARPEAVVSELAASATMPVRAVQCREIARRIDSARQCTRTALTSAAKIPYVFQITKMFFVERKTKKPLTRRNEGGKHELVTAWRRVVRRLRNRNRSHRELGAGAETHPHRLSGDPVRPRRAHRRTIAERRADVRRG